MPHKAIDTVVAGAAIVMALQTIVARNVDPFETAVVTVGAFHAGQAHHVIPDEAVLKLSVRALSPQVRTQLKERIVDLVNLQAASYQVRDSVDWQEG
jgi:hippurate hydrolase